MTAISIDPWDPGYTAALAAEALEEGPAAGRTSAVLDLTVECDPADWKPVTPSPATVLPASLLIADGVRRIDARVWVHDPGGAAPEPGLAASYAAGVVRCAARGTPAELVTTEVARALFTASPTPPT